MEAPAELDTRDPDCELTADGVAGQIHVYFLETTLGSRDIHRDVVQARLRELVIPYSWTHEIYVGEDGYAEETRYWHPGFDEEIVRDDGGALPHGWWEKHEGLEDAELGRALRLAMAPFEFRPEPVRAQRP